MVTRDVGGLFFAAFATASYLGHIISEFGLAHVKRKIHQSFSKFMGKYVVVIKAAIWKVFEWM